MPLPSKREVHLVGDIFEEADRAISFVNDVSKTQFVENLLINYAVQKALLNMAEACIHIEKENKGRFSTLFPGLALRDIKMLGDRLRHDYGAISPALVWDELQSTVPDMMERAKLVLESSRRADGGGEP